MEILHGDEGMAVLFIDLVNGADVGMVERGGRAGFALEALQGAGIAGGVFGEKFEGDHAAESHVFSLIDDAHASSAQLLQDAIVRDDLVGHPRGTHLDR
jgi:hypothetical protein